MENAEKSEHDFSFWKPAPMKPHSESFGSLQRKLKTKN